MINNIIKRNYSDYFENKPENTEFRIQITDENSRKIRGYGAVFNQKSKLITEYCFEFNEVRTFYEQIKETAFNRALKAGNDIILNLNHNSDEILARTASNTLQLSTNIIGLVYEADMPNTARGLDVFEMVKRGDYYESSFQFTTVPNTDVWEKQSDGTYLKTITEVDRIIDVCVATYRGAYSNTSIEVLDKKRTEETEIKIEQNNYQYELENDVDKLKMLQAIFKK